MKAFLSNYSDSMVVIELEGQSVAERVLLSHLAEKHTSIVCVGKYGDGPEKGKGMRLLLMNKIEEPEQRRRRR